MPRRQLIRVPLQDCHQMVDTGSPDSSQKLLDIGGWKKEEIVDFIKDMKIPPEKTPNIAFFQVLITELDSQSKLADLIEALELPVPRHMSAFVRYIKSETTKAFRTLEWSLLTELPRPLRTKDSLIISVCSELQLTEQWFLDDSDECYTGEGTINRGMILELMAFKKSNGISDVKCTKWVQRLFQLPAPPHPGTLRLQWHRISEHAGLLKGKKQEQNEYLLGCYQPPRKVREKQPDPESEEQIGKYEVGFGNDTILPACPVVDLIGLEGDCVQVTEVPSLAKLAENVLENSYRDMLHGKQENLKNLDNLIDTKRDELVKIDRNIELKNAELSKKSHYLPRNVNKRDKRRAAKDLEIKELRGRLEETRHKLNNANKLKSKWKLQAESWSALKSTDSNDIDAVVEITQYQHQLQLKEIECKSLEDEILELKDKLRECQDSQEGEQYIETRDGRQYNARIRQLYMKLLSSGMPVSKVSDFVKETLELADKKPVALPKKATVGRMQTECEIHAHMHAHDVMMEAEKNATLHFDGTRKKFTEYGGYQVSTNEQAISLGMQEMVTGEAESYLDTLKEIFQDIAEAMTDNPEERNVINAKLNATIKNMMTDRHIVNKAFQKKYEDYRRDIFNQCLDDLNIPDNETEKAAAVNALFCGLHVIGNIGSSSAAEALKMFESAAFHPTDRTKTLGFQKGNARTYDLVYEASQAFTKSGNQRWGCAQEWIDFLARPGIEVQNKFVSFLHERFNVIFQDGAALYYHKEHITSFLTEGDCPNDNRLLKTVRDSIGSAVCLSAARALGIFGILVTTPLWKQLSKKKGTALELNPRWEVFLQFLERMSDDAGPLLGLGAPQPQCVFHDVNIDFSTDICRCLFAPTDDDFTSLTKQCLELICVNAYELVKRQLCDQLPGGIFANPTEQTLIETASCPPTNMISEKHFSDLDRDVNKAPKRLTSNRSGLISFTTNNTASYLASLPPEERQRRIERALKLSAARRLKNNVRQRSIQKQRQERQLERRRKKEEKTAKMAAKKRELIDKITEAGGVWKTDKDVRTNGTSRESIKDQINFHATVLQTKVSDKSLFKFSKGGKNLSNAQLQDNLIAIIKGDSGVAGSASGDTGGPAHVVRTQEERSLLIEEAKMKVKEKTKEKTKVKVVQQGTNNKRKRKAKIVRKEKATKPLVSKQNPPKRRRQIAATVVPFRHANREECSVDTLVAVAYDDNWYIGKVLSPENDGKLQVEFMEWMRKGTLRWQANSEVGCLPLDHVLLAGVVIEPKDSSLRLWKVESQVEAQISELYRRWQNN